MDAGITHAGLVTGMRDERFRGVFPVGGGPGMGH